MRLPPTRRHDERVDVVYAAWDAVWLEDARWRLRDDGEPHRPTERALAGLDDDERRFIVALAAGQLKGSALELLCARFGPRRAPLEHDDDLSMPVTTPADLGEARLRRRGGYLARPADA